MDTIPTIHASRLGSILDCPRRAVWEHLNGGDGRGAVPAATLVGQLAHSHLESILVKNNYAAANLVYEARDMGVVLDGTTPTIVDAALQAERIALLAAAEIRNRWPSGDFCTELPVEARIGPVNVVGRIDCLAEGRVIDLKTGRSSISHGAQLGAYATLTDSTENPQVIEIPRKRYADDIEISGIVEYDWRECTEAARTAVHSWYHYLGYHSNDWSLPANPLSRHCLPGVCPIHGTDECPITVYREEN